MMIQSQSKIIIIEITYESNLPYPYVINLKTAGIKSKYKGCHEDAAKTKKELIKNIKNLVDEVLIQDTEI